MYDVTVKMERVNGFDISLQVESLGRTKNCTVLRKTKFSGLSNSVDIDAFYRLGKDKRKSRLWVIF